MCEQLIQRDHSLVSIAGNIYFTVSLIRFAENLKLHNDSTFCIFLYVQWRSIVINFLIFFKQSFEFWTIYLFPSCLFFRGRKNIEILFIVSRENNYPRRMTKLRFVSLVCASKRYIDQSCLGCQYFFQSPSNFISVTYPDIFTFIE